MPFGSLPRAFLAGADRRDRGDAFPGMDDGQACDASRLKQALGRRDRTSKQRDVVAERSAEPAGFEEIPLHIDDHEAGLRRDQIERIWLRRDDPHDNPSLLPDRSF